LVDYKEAGVNIDAGEEAVERIKAEVKSTFSPNVLQGIGHFGAFYEAAFPDYEKPVLVSSADGVGTKLKIAYAMGIHDTVGQCLVNHCVDDILTSGAKPLFFLDYIGTGSLSPDVIEAIIKGMSKACRENACSLVGGEMAEMPGIYNHGEYDVAGTIVGLVEKNKIVNGSAIQPGQILIGLPSVGLHTNGYSLARKVLESKFQYTDMIPEFGKSLGEELLTVHPSYLHVIQDILEKCSVTGLSHITGGGAVGNTKRIFPKGMTFDIHWQNIPNLPIFELIQKTGQIETSEMRRVFNMGVGFIIVAEESESDAIMEIIMKAQLIPFIAGVTRSAQ
jgi:phosphoribosylformylglycinamidine cyclo-ligase